ncbi:pentapeptide repeat-containing protein [Rhizobium leguminosarum]|uniref:pentapeptide repeat-containing protein n=1 Tax=Rhizobium leguminosarum TaxID=384 RepID=UPI001C923E6B|nr:pentapeptide repeat-containing protein [Rhizobium leguminosarum]MBY2905734.1 pentapeptide repeat-containing protein [Rhizobium leguminosarum]
MSHLRNSPSPPPMNPPQMSPIGRTIVSHHTVRKAEWQNAEILDLNALKTVFEDCDFSYSVIENGYFRDAVFRNCRFVGAKFIDCNFKSANFYKCDFKFALFHTCLLEVPEILASLPAEPNIRREALQNLKANAAETGDYSSLGLLTLQEIDAAKRHFSYALHGYDTYYKNKYASIFSKARAGASLFGLWLAGIIWGHGERPWRLLVSCFLILCGLSFLNFWSLMPRIGWSQAERGLRSFEYISRLFLDLSPDSSFAGFVAVDYIVVLMRYLYIGLFISILYKSISRR